MKEINVQRRLKLSRLPSLYHPGWQQLLGKSRISTELFFICPHFPTARFHIEERCFWIRLPVYIWFRSVRDAGKACPARCLEQFRDSLDAEYAKEFPGQTSSLGVFDELYNIDRLNKAKLVQLCSYAFIYIWFCTTLHFGRIFGNSQYTAGTFIGRFYAAWKCATTQSRRPKLRRPCNRPRFCATRFMVSRLAHDQNSWVVTKVSGVSSAIRQNFDCYVNVKRNYVPCCEKLFCRPQLSALESISGHNNNNGNSGTAKPLNVASTVLQLAAQCRF